MAALALLAKYSSIFLLASCLIAALLHPRRASYFGSRAPYAALLACSMLCLPHAIWVFQHQLTPVNYLLQKPQMRFQARLFATGTSLLGVAALFVLPQAALATLMGLPESLRLLIRAGVAAVSADRGWLLALAAGPLTLTLIAGLATGVKLSTNYFLPTLFLFPIAVTAASFPLAQHARLGLLWRFVAGWLIFGLLAAPLVAVTTFVLHVNQAVEPRREIAQEATRLWHEAFGRPLRFVAGTEAFGLGVPFYSADPASLYILAAPDASPWITASDIARDGLLIVCDRADVDCIAEATRTSSPVTRRQSVRLAHGFLGWVSRDFNFELFMVPPTTRQ